MSKLRTKFKKIAIRILTISTALTTVLSPLGTTTIYAADKISDGTEWSYNYSGKTETFTVPVSGTYKLEIAGAQGGNYDVYKGGYGGSVAGNVFLNKGDTLKITVGSQAGYNGGGTGTLSNGGGATSIKVNNNTYAIAGGGGGAGLTNNGGNGGTTASKVDANNGENSAKSNSAGGGSGYKGGTAGYLIYHTHTGDSINGGGCYSKAISHTHDESKGCYTKCTAKLKCTGTTYDDDSNRRHVMYCGSGHGPFFHTIAKKENNVDHVY